MKIVSGSVLFNKLVNMGLSPFEAKTYEALLATPQTVKEIAKEIGVLPNAVYRLLSQLDDKGLIAATNAHPAVYKAITPRVVWDTYVKNGYLQKEKDKDELLSLIKQPQKSDQTNIEVINNIKDFFSSYTRLSKIAKREILIISIGEEVPENVLLANRDALGKGIKIKFIAHVHNQTNHPLLVRWVRMGLEVRHFPSQGFHLVVIDSNTVLLAVSDPKDTQNRTAIVFNNPSFAEAMTSYFQSVWDKALVIED